MLSIVSQIIPARLYVGIMTLTNGRLFILEASMLLEHSNSKCCQPNACHQFTKARQFRADYCSAMAIESEQKGDVSRERRNRENPKSFAKAKVAECDGEPNCKKHQLENIADGCIPRLTQRKEHGRRY
jgi:hypothetical protein